VSAARANAIYNATGARVREYPITLRSSSLSAVRRETSSPLRLRSWTPARGGSSWAYRYGNEYRSSDDGEPSGTAGRPILAAIDGQGFDRVMVVVTRWYGGIKLGAGGLVRAYGGTAAECLRVAPRLPLIAMAELDVQAGFEDLGPLHAALGAHLAEKVDEAFTSDGVNLHLRLPADQVEPLKNRLRDATRDRVRIESRIEPGPSND